VLKILVHKSKNFVLKNAKKCVKQVGVKETQKIIVKKFRAKK